MSDYSYRGHLHTNSYHHSCYCCTPHVPSCCHSVQSNVCGVAARCPSALSFTELQSFCNSVRGGQASSVCSPIPDHGGFHVHSPSENSFQHGLEGSECFENDGGIQAEEDIGAEWFDEVAMGLESPDHKFDFPVPCETCLSTDQLNIMTLGDREFFADNQGYVQVHTYGECYKPFSEASIGVWFGPDHPCNKSELVHRGRRTAEAAHFVAIIEAIRAAGACGVTKLQINTEYENAVRFMLYFIFKWENNGWLTVKGTPVKNQVLIRELDYYSRFLEIKWNVVCDEETEGLIEAYNLANEALTCSENIAKVNSKVQAVDEVIFGLQKSGLSKSTTDSAFGRAEASNVIKTFIPCGVDDAERQAARRQRFAPY